MLFIEKRILFNVKLPRIHKSKPTILPYNYDRMSISRGTNIFLVTHIERLRRIPWWFLKSPPSLRTTQGTQHPPSESNNRRLSVTSGNLTGWPSVLPFCVAYPLLADGIQFRRPDQADLIDSFNDPSNRHRPWGISFYHSGSIGLSEKKSPLTKLDGLGCSIEVQFQHLQTVGTSSLSHRG